MFSIHLYVDSMPCMWPPRRLLFDDEDNSTMNVINLAPLLMEQSVVHLFVPIRDGHVPDTASCIWSAGGITPGSLNRISDGDLQGHIYRPIGDTAATR